MKLIGVGKTYEPTALPYLKGCILDKGKYTDAGHFFNRIPRQGGEVWI
jgi:hypothetical protein